MFGALAAAALAAMAAGCSSSVQLDGRLAAATGPTIAFESIDGPPPEVFEKLVAAIGHEAGARQVAVVSRAGPADYRVRGYLTAAVSRDQVALAWVWDIYDADKRRVQRIGGEEVVRGRHGDAWAAADQSMLRRIAGSGVERMAAFLKAPQAPAPAAPSGTAVAGRTDAPSAVALLARP